MLLKPYLLFLLGRGGQTQRPVVGSLGVLAPWLPSANGGSPCCSPASVFRASLPHAHRGSLALSTPTHRKIVSRRRSRRLRMAQPPTPRDLSSSLYLCLPHTARDTKPTGLARGVGVCGGPGIRASPPRGAKTTGRAGAAGPHSRPVLRLCLWGSIRAWPFTPGQAGAAGAGLVLGILNTPAPPRGS